MSLKFSYSSAIILLAFYVPFEVLLLKYLPVSEKVYSLLRFAPEVIIYLLLTVKLIQNLYHRHWLSKTPIDKLLIIFIISAIISIIINSAPIILSFIGLRTLLRYVALYYLVSCIDFSTQKIKRLIVGLILIGGIQGFLAAYQHYFGLSTWFYPRATDLEIAGVQSQYRILVSGWHGGREQGAGIGTFGDSVLLAIFLLFIAVLAHGYLLKIDIKSFRFRMFVYCIFFLTLYSLFLTYSRASALFGIITVPVMLFMEGKIKKLFFLCTLFTILIASILFEMATESPTNITYFNPRTNYINPIDNITNVFSKSYVQNNMRHSRGWVIVEIGGGLIKSFSLFGYGPAGDVSLGRMVKEDIGSKIPFSNLGIINDVFWVALLSYYGFVGVIIYFFILWKIYRASTFVYKNSVVSLYSMIGLCMAVIIIFTLPYTFIIRTFLFRSFGFYFWLLAGFVAAEYRRIKFEQSLN